MPKVDKRTNYHAKQWQLLSMLGVINLAISIPFALWFIIGGFDSWITLGIPIGVLIFTGFGFLFANIFWSLFSVVKLLSSRGAGRYRYFKISTVAVLITCLVTGGYFRGDYDLRTNKPLIAMAGADPTKDVIIACYTTVPQSNLVLQYHLKGDLTLFNVLDSGNGTAHRFLLSGLLSNSTYVYRLATNAMPGPQVPPELDQELVFKTSPRNSRWPDLPPHRGHSFRYANRARECDGVHLHGSTHRGGRLN